LTAKGRFGERDVSFTARQLGKLEELGFVQKAFDNEGNAFYSHSGQEVPDWLTTEAASGTGSVDTIDLDNRIAEAKREVERTADLRGPAPVAAKKTLDKLIKSRESASATQKLDIPDPPEGKRFKPEERKPREPRKKKPRVVEKQIKWTTGQNSTRIGATITVDGDGIVTAIGSAIETRTKTKESFAPQIGEDFEEWHKRVGGKFHTVRGSVKREPTTTDE